MSKHFFLLLFATIVFSSCKLSLIEDNFSDNRNNWHINTTDSIRYNNIENGVLVIDSKPGSAGFSLIEVDGYDGTLSNSVSANIKFIDKYMDQYTVGLLIGSQRTNELDAFYIFGIDKGRVYVGHESFTTPSHNEIYFEQESDLLKINEYNLFEYKKEETDGKLSFYLNGSKIIEIAPKYHIGKNLGFIAVNARMEADNFAVTMNP